MTSTAIRLSVTTAILALVLGGGFAAAETVPTAQVLPVPPAPGSTLDDRFLNPPNAARPRVWWHWIGGNVSREGARLDLEWMQRIGIGGFHAFSGELSMRAPLVVPKRVPFMSDEWKAAMRDALQFAKPTGMEVGIAGSPGWSHTGGPWVPAEDGMKKYVWSETRIKGGAAYIGTLAAPPGVSGPFQAIALTGRGASGPQLYRDARVIAFPTPAAEVATGPANLIASNGADLAPIHSSNASRSIKLAASGPAGNAWIEVRYPAATELSGVTLALPAGARVEVQAGAGGAFRTIATSIVESQAESAHPLVQQTIAIAPTRAETFRVVLWPIEQPVLGPLGPGPQDPPKPPANSVEISNVEFLTGARVDRFEAKAGFQPTLGRQDYPTPAGPGAIPPSRVIDLTARLRPDGRLDWTPPKGDWTVLRLGWSLTGRTNNPAEREATGLEVDKFDPAAVRRYMDRYLAMYQEATGSEFGPNGIQTLLTDSWEAGVQNWTPKIGEEFRKRRGYDFTPYLPVLAGRVVGSSEISDRFLVDFRRTLEELVADNHQKVLAEALHARSMTYYTEIQGDTPRAIADGMTVKARSDIPTAEYWYRSFTAGPGQYSLKADMEEAASAAHVYGKPLAAAESLTVAALYDPWAFSPRMLKPVADEIFAHGINRIIYHESYHQPLVDKKPGLFLGLFGQFFNRNDTWAEDAKPWIDYLARTSQMLQEGRYVADVAYFYGEERNLTELFRWGPNTDVPQGYRYDYINSEALLTLLSVRNGRIVTPSGMDYRILYVPSHVTRYSLPALRKLRDLIAAGAVVVAPKPVGGLGLADSDAEVRKIADQVWGKGAASGRPLGKGMVYASPNLAPVLAERGVTPDFSFTGTSKASRLLALHRRSADADIYFVSNQQDRPETVDASFRIVGKVPELWRAETGKSEPLSYRREGERTVTPLKLEPHEAVFVVFRRDAASPQRTVFAGQSTELRTLSGPWTVSFEPGRGAPASATFDKLISWPESSDPGIRYFSGGATYAQTLDVPGDWLISGRKVQLELGDVKELAVVSVNGKVVTTAWHAPYKADLTGTLHPGANRLEIKVVNLWPNRLIGDKQPGAKPVAFAPQSTYRSNSPLLPSGLLGPVRVLAVDGPAR